MDLKLWYFKVKLCLWTKMCFWAVVEYQAWQCEMSVNLCFIEFIELILSHATRPWHNPGLRDALKQHTWLCAQKLACKHDVRNTTSVRHAMVMHTKYTIKMHVAPHCEVSTRWVTPLNEVSTRQGLPKSCACQARPPYHWVLVNMPYWAVLLFLGFKEVLGYFIDQGIN